eukprot:2278024-Rhodomonas_salina.2
MPEVTRQRVLCTRVCAQHNHETRSKQRGGQLWVATDDAAERRCEHRDQQDSSERREDRHHPPEVRGRVAVAVPDRCRPETHDGKRVSARANRPDTRARQRHNVRGPSDDAHASTAMWRGNSSATCPEQLREKGEHARDEHDPERVGQVVVVCLVEVAGSGVERPL